LISGLQVGQVSQSINFIRLAAGKSQKTFQIEGVDKLRFAKNN